MQKVMILGDTGLVGRQLVEDLKADYEVIGLSRSDFKTDYKHIQFDIEKDDILPLLIDEMPDYFISVSRGDFKYQKICHKTVFDYSRVDGMRVYFYSTANVFDGLADSVKKEDDPVMAESDYGKYKISVENMCKESNGVIIRLPMVLASDSPRTNMLRSKKEVTVPHKVITTCVSTQLISQMQHYIMKHDLAGIFHFAPNDTIFMKDMFKAIAGTENFLKVDKIKDYYLAIVNAREDLPFKFTNLEVIESIKTW